MGRTFNFITICFVALLFLFAPLTASAHTLAGGNGRIYGQLLDNTNKNAPLGGQTVTLQVDQSGNAQDLATARADAHGNFNFPNLSTDKTLNYAVYIKYQGAQYTTALVTLDSKPVQQLNLTVYEATGNASRLAVVQTTLLVHAPNVQKGTITVSEVLFFKNLDTRTYVGSLDATHGRPNALFFSVPLHGRNVALGAGFNSYNVIQVDRGFASNAAVPPGNSQFSFTYDIPYSTSSYDFTYTAFYPTVQLILLVPPSMQATSSGLNANGLITVDQQPYRQFETTKLLTNQTFHVELQGLPVPATASAPSPLSQSTLWLIVGGLLMLAIIVVTAFIARFNLRLASRRHGKSVSSGHHGKHARQTASEKPRTNAKEREGQSDTEKALLQELLKLDKSYESGKISKATYQERRAKTKARLRSLLSEQEVGRR